MTAVDPGPAQRIRTLPIRVEPLVGEAIDSWLETLAARSLAPYGDLLVAVGLRVPRPEERTRRPRLNLQPAELSSLSTAAGVSPSVLTQMTLNGLVPEMSDVEVGRDAARNRVLLLGSRFCPACLAATGGRWSLWWRLRWAFACPAHGSLLAHVCPQCARAQRARAIPRESTPTPGHCMLPAASSSGKHSPRCGADLSTVDVLSLPPGHAAIAAQQRILDVVAAGATSAGIYRTCAVSSTQYLRDLAAIGMRALRYGSPAELTAAAATGDISNLLREHAESRVGQRLDGSLLAPRSVAQTALAACIAVPVLSATSVEAAGKQLQWLIESTRARGFAVSATNVGWARGVSTALIGVQLAALSPFLGHADDIRYRCLTSRPRRPVPVVPVAQRSLPSLFWYRWALPLCGTNVGFEQLQLALSVAVMLASGRVPLREACGSLGAVTTDRAASRVLQALAARPDWAATTVMLTELADLLADHPAPIDYERRRRLPMGSLLPEPLWHNICRDLAIKPGGGIKLRVFRCWLYGRITGSPARLCEHVVGTSEFRAKVADLPRTLFPELVSALDDAARGFLDEHGLAHEPLRWSPPDRVAQAWLSRRPYHVKAGVTRVHALIRAQDATLGTAAGELGMPIEVVREVLNDHPIPRPTFARGGRRANGIALIDARAQLDREHLVDLYVRQGLGLHAIAGIAGTSRQTVTRLAREYGIVLRPPHAPRGR